LEKLMAGTTPRMPKGLGYHGQKLWRTVVAEYELETEPHKVEILTQAAKVADVIAELDKAAAKSPLTVRGSAGQQVISPTLAEARFQRGLLAQLLGKLGLPDAEEEPEEQRPTRTRSESARLAANARWGSVVR
jgi:hypothetical protein